MTLLICRRPRNRLHRLCSSTSSGDRPAAACVMTSWVSPRSKVAGSFLVKLSLDEPDESILVAYDVFGQDPIWVYRREDLDMIMHWETRCLPILPAGRTAKVRGHAENEGRIIQSQAQDSSFDSSGPGHASASVPCSVESVNFSLFRPLFAQQQAESFGDSPRPDLAAQRRKVTVAE